MSVKGQGEVPRHRWVAPRAPPKMRRGNKSYPDEEEDEMAG